MAKIKYTTYISPYHKVLLEGMMKETGKSASEILREALDGFLCSPDNPREKND
jgi:hypothetical protein